MRELVKITEHNGNKLISARELYNYLEINERFSRWFGRMCKYSLVEGVDYTPYQNVHPLNDQSLDDYALTLDCAKAISMLQRNEKGNEARRYFIEVEKQAKSLAKPKSTLDILELTIKGLKEQQEGLDEVKRDVMELKAKTTTIPDYYTIAGYGTIRGLKIGLKLASKIGRAASGICKKHGWKIEQVPDPRFGLVNSYPKQAIDQAFSETQIA